MATTPLLSNQFSLANGQQLSPVRLSKRRIGEEFLSSHLAGQATFPSVKELIYASCISVLQSRLKNAGYSVSVTEAEQILSACIEERRQAREDYLRLTLSTTGWSADSGLSTKQFQHTAKSLAAFTTKYWFSQPGRPDMAFALARMASNKIPPLTMTHAAGGYVDRIFLIRPINMCVVSAEFLEELYKEITVKLEQGLCPRRTD